MRMDDAVRFVKTKNPEYVIRRFLEMSDDTEVFLAREIAEGLLLNYDAVKAVLLRLARKKELSSVRMGTRTFWGKHEAIRRFKEHLKKTYSK